MRKLLTIIFLTALIVSGCAKVEESNLEGKTVGLAISTLTNPFFVSLEQGAKAEAKATKLTLIVTDSQDDPQKEREDVADLVAKKVDVLLINPVDSSTVGKAIKLANDKNIPVITLDRSADDGIVLSHIASDNFSGGKMAGELLASKLNKKGNVVELEGIPGTSAALERGRGFNDAMSETEIKTVAKEPADFDRETGKSVMAKILETQPQIDAVFAHNDEMALGALQAIRDAGRKEIKVVGFDATGEAVESVQTGGLIATVAQQPTLIGKYGIEAAAKAIQGKQVEKEIPVQLKLIAN